LAGAPHDFDTLEAAQSRVDEIMAAQHQTHHTYLDIVSYHGDKAVFLKAEGILF